jgi:hypothetical protein
VTSSDGGIPDSDSFSVTMILGSLKGRHSTGRFARTAKIMLAVAALGATTVSGPAAATSQSRIQSQQVRSAASFAGPTAVACAAAPMFAGLGPSWLPVVCAPAPAPAPCHLTSTCTPPPATRKGCKSAATSSSSAGGASAMSSACSSSGSAASVACTPAGCSSSSSGRGGSCSSGTHAGCRPSSSRASAACSVSGTSASCSLTSR